MPEGCGEVVGGSIGERKVTFLAHWPLCVPTKGKEAKEHTRLS